MSGMRRGCALAAMIVALGSGGLAGATPPAAPSGGAASAVPGGATTGTPAALLAVTSDSECPSSSSVSTTLRSILGVGSKEHVSESASIAHEEGMLVVGLRGGDGRLLGQRALPLEGSCEELARAAAVVIASWLTTAHPELAGHAGPTPEASNEAGKRAPGASPTTAPGTLAGEVRSRGTVEPVGRFAPEVGGALGLGVLPAPTSLAGMLFASMLPETTGLGATLRLGVAASRSLAVDGGRVRYSRWPLGAAAVLRLAGKRVSAELELGAAVGSLRLEGRSFRVDRNASDVTGGAFLNGRAIASRGTVLPFIEVSSLLWARVARAYSDPGRPSVALPALDLTLFFGAAFRP